MSDQVLVAVISALGSALVAWITAHENRKKTEDKDDLEEGIIYEITSGVLFGNPFLEK